MFLITTRHIYRTLTSSFIIESLIPIRNFPRRVFLLFFLSFFLPSYIFPSWLAVRSYRPNLEGRDPIWSGDWAHRLRRWSPSWGFPGVFISYKVYVRRSVQSPRYHIINTLSLADKRDWHDTQGKWPLARNPDRSWCHHHTSSWNIDMSTVAGS